MSVINKMLKDLAQREAADSKSTASIPLQVQAEKSSKRSGLLFILIAVFVIAALWYFLFSGSSSDKQVTTTLSANQTDLIIPLPSAAEGNTTPNAEDSLTENTSTTADLTPESLTAEVTANTAEQETVASKLQASTSTPLAGSALPAPSKDSATQQGETAAKADASNIAVTPASASSSSQAAKTDNAVKTDSAAKAAPAVTPPKSTAAKTASTNTTTPAKTSTAAKPSAPAKASTTAKTSPPARVTAPRTQSTQTPRRAAKPDEVKAQIYRVAAGDTLFSIAMVNNIRLRDITQWNNLNEHSQLTPGQTLFLSNPAGPQKASVVSNRPTPAQNTSRAMPVRPTNNIEVNTLTRPQTFSMQQTSSVPGATLPPASMRTGLERASQAVLNQQWSIALSYLSEEGPVTTFPEYYALKALVLQQSQQWRPALALYEQLLLIEPSQPVWNLSAGIASQQLGFLESSQQYFKRASQQQNKLPLTSQQFLARQLASNN